tara:strand:+ start:1506 stop:1634 length:129 start_codon:yes stop_codon:yes gene_type:complete
MRAFSQQRKAIFSELNGEIRMNNWNAQKEKAHNAKSGAQVGA